MPISFGQQCHYYHNDNMLLARVCRTLNPTTIQLVSRASSSSGGERYIDQVLNELECRGLKEDSDIRNQDAFKLFQLEKKFTIDEHKLKKEMRKLQTLLHPDKFVCKDKDSQDKSEQLSSLVNEAYAILKNPYKRAKYLLSLMEVKQVDEIEHDLDDLKLDSNFLERMMDLRENIDSFPLIELAKIRVDIDSELTNVIAEVNKDFKKRQYDSILSKLGKLKFLTNCMEALEIRLGSSGNF